MTNLDHPDVQAYLARLEALADHLGSARYGSLRSDVEEYLAETLPTAANDDAVAQALVGLGAPEALVAEAAGVPLRAETAVAGGSPRLEQAALLASGLSVAAALSVVVVVLAPFFWLVGVVLTLLSRRWRAGDKALAAVAYGVLGFPLLTALTTFTTWGSASTCVVGEGSDGLATATCLSIDPWQHRVEFAAAGAALLTVWVWAGVYLWRKAHRTAPAKEERVIRMR
ncbi:MAG: hypothetical protein ACRCXL_03170 [Dermatophilaceae bacterium]